MLGVAYGVLHWKPDDLDRYEFNDLKIAINGLYNARWEDWEQAKYISFYTRSAFVKTKWNDLHNPLDKKRRLDSIEDKEVRHKRYEYFREKVEKRERLERWARREALGLPRNGN